MNADQAMSIAVHPARSCVALGLMLLMLGGCSQKDSETPPPPPKASVPVASTPLAAPPANTPRVIVEAWNHALDQHDLSTLASLYGDEVDFYGQHLSRAAVLKAKQHALTTDQDFHQSIVSDIQFEEDGDHTLARFDKRVQGKHPAQVEAHLVLLGQRIIGESDAPTDLRRASADSSACFTVTQREVNALGEVKAILEHAQQLLASANDGRSIGGMGPEAESDGSFSGSLGVNSSERFENLVIYSVDPAGKLEVQVEGNDIDIPAAAAQAVRLACQHH